MTTKLLNNKVIDGLAKSGFDDVEKIKGKMKYPLKMFDEPAFIGILDGIYNPNNGITTLDQAISIVNLFSDLCVDSNYVMNPEGKGLWNDMYLTIIQHTGDCLLRFLDYDTIIRLYMDSINEARKRLKLDEPVNNEVQEEIKNQEPDEVIEVQPKAKKKPQEEQAKQEQVNRKAAARETIDKLTNGIKIVPADANVSKVAAAMNANNGRVRPDFSAFVQQPIYPEPQYNGFVPTIQPTASQVNVPQYNSNVMTGQPIQPQGPAQYNENVAQNMQQQQPINNGPRHLPKFENKKGLYNMNTLAGVDIKEKADVIHQHYKLISGAHKDTLEVQIDVLMSLITSHQIYNECKKNKVIIPSTGLTFTEIPVETYGNRVDLSKFDMAFRIDQQTKTGENLIVYTNTMNSKTLRQAIFLPSSNPKKNNNQMAGHNHPDGCGCGHC